MSRVAADVSPLTLPPRAIRADLRRLLLGFTGALCLVSTASNGIALPAAALVIGHGRRHVALNANGAVVGWVGALAQATAPPDATAGEIRYRGERLPLAKPEVVRAADWLEFEYRWSTQPDLEVIIRHRTVPNRGVFLWTREVRVRGRQKLGSDLTVSLQSWPGHLASDTWLPLINGTGADLGTNSAAVFHFAGAPPGDGPLLALPMVGLPLRGGRARLMIATDPYFSTRLQSDTIEWTYLSKAGVGEEPRTLVVAEHPGSVEDSIDWFFRGVLPEIAPGPAWLHQIALVDFDYLSDGGQGWFRDIDALTVAMPRPDRHQAFLCLHGWYDFLGRYCFDDNSGKLDRHWTAFSNYTNALKAAAVGTIGGTQVNVGSDMDALVWDETFHVPCGTLGTDARPGYADQAMMRLVRDLTLLVQDDNRRHRRQIALLASDCLGAAYGDALKAPYALVAHGTYQDSWCQPRAWSYGVFANYRNVLWSCCWWPVSKWSWIEFGVREYQAPVAVSNGWGDDKGFSDPGATVARARVIQLAERASHPIEVVRAPASRTGQPFTTSLVQTMPSRRFGHGCNPDELEFSVAWTSAVSARSCR